MRPQLALLLAVATATSPGCTLIGTKIGESLDNRKAPRPVLAPTWEVRTLSPGTFIALTLGDGERIEGYFGGMERRPEPEYVPLYTAARASRPTGLELPELGPGEWLDTAGAAREAELVGLDLRGVVLRQGGNAHIEPFESVAGFRDRSGRTTSGEVLRRLVQAHYLPTLSMIRFQQPVRSVPADDVAQITLYESSNSGAKVGLLIGVAVDVAVIILAAQSLNRREYQSCLWDPNCTSCPIVWAFDGRTWQREAEMLGAATLESAQLTDRESLGRVEAPEGLYRIRVANEMEEIDHLDAVRLLAVDLPPGARAVASPQGRVLTLADPRPARRVADARGRDLGRTLAATDGQVWLGSPLGRDPERPEDRSESIVLEFDRPRDARAVTLAFTGRSTEWGVRMLVELLSLQGPGLDAWRKRVNADSAARTAFLSALAREGLPKVRIWDGREWRLVGMLRNLGPALAREQALRVPLAGVPGDVLRVRVDATPGFWELDSAAADFSDPAPADIGALQPVYARMGGRDVSPLLAAEDGSRLTLRRGESVELAFRTPAEPARGERSILVEATGYYTPLVHAAAPADPALFQRLVSEPGAFGRYNLERLRAEHDRALAALAPAASR